MVSYLDKNNNLNRNCQNIKSYTDPRALCLGLCISIFLLGLIFNQPGSLGVLRDLAVTNICLTLTPSHSVWYLKQANTENSFKGPLHSAFFHKYLTD